MSNETFFSEERVARVAAPFPLLSVMFSNTQLLSAADAPLMSKIEWVVEVDSLEGSTVTELSVREPEVAEMREHSTDESIWNVREVNVVVAPAIEKTEEASVIE